MYRIRNRIVASICAMILVLAGCANDYSLPSLNQQEIHFEASHGVDSFDVLSDKLTYNGEPLSIDYTFVNGNIDSNYGLFLFLDGMLQPYYTNFSDEYKNMHIFSLSKDSSTTFKLYFEPVTGEIGQEIPLHIVAIFDADAPYENPTLSNSFWQMLSQAFPLTVKIEAETQQNDKSTDLSIEGNNYSLSIELIQEYGLSEGDGHKKLVIDENINSIKPNQDFQFSLSGADDHQSVYRLYAFINNAPIAIGDHLWYEMSLSENQTIDATACLIQENDTPECDKYLYIIAVPLHSIETNAEGENVLKSKSIPIS